MLDASEPKGPGLIGNPAEWFGPDAYPAVALRAGEQGRVVVAVHMDIQGRVTSCSVDTSSGSTTLDQTTCNIASTHIFQPGIDDNGKPIASVYKLAVRWVLPVAGPVQVAGDLKDSAFEYILVVDADGKIVSCRLTQPADGTSDVCDHFQVGSLAGPGWRRGERAVGATLTRRYTEHVAVDP